VGLRGKTDKVELQWGQEDEERQHSTSFLEQPMFLCPCFLGNKGRNGMKKEIQKNVCFRWMQRGYLESLS
jgi:hypothetical protein